MKCTFIVGIDHVSVLREVSGAERAGRARERERRVGRSMLMTNV
jgi:hypothetical protein